MSLAAKLRVRAHGDRVVLLVPGEPPVIVAVPAPERAVLPAEAKPCRR
jgi:hypothetical protein